MTLDEYKALFPRNEVFVQVDDTERIMTPEEYEAWCIEGVYWTNHDPLKP